MQIDSQQNHESFKKNEQSFQQSPSNNLDSSFDLMNVRKSNNKYSTKSILHLARQEIAYSGSELDPKLNPVRQSKRLAMK